MVKEWSCWVTWRWRGGGVNGDNWETMEKLASPLFIIITKSFLQFERPCRPSLLQDPTLITEFFSKSNVSSIFMRSYILDFLYPHPNPNSVSGSGSTGPANRIQIRNHNTAKAITMRLCKQRYMITQTEADVGSWIQDHKVRYTLHNITIRLDIRSI
jgi:hypothetical protein